MPVRFRLITAILACAGLAITLVAMLPSLATAGTGPQRTVTNLAIGVRQQHQLLSRYAAYRHIPVRDIAPVMPGQTLAVTLPSGREWVMIHFIAAAGAPMSVRTAFQDGAGTGIFTRAPGGAWTVAGLGAEPMGCGVKLPAAVRQTWHLANCQASQKTPLHPAAPAGTTGDLANIALDQVGVSDNPAEHSFDGLDCNPYTTLVGNPDGASAAGCGKTSNGKWFSNEQDTSEFWCADFTKWVWEKAGVTSDLGTLTPSAASFYTWGVAHGEHISFGGKPTVGDAVLFYPSTASSPNGSYADHVGIVASINSNGSLNLVDGDFLGSSNISVQYNTDVSGPSWYASGEHWAFVSPKLASTTGSTGPAVAVNPSTDAQYAFWRGSDGDLHSANASSSGHWGSAVNMCDVYTVGCNMQNAPGAAVADDGTQYVFWLGTDNDLHSAHADPSGHWGSAVNMCDVYAVGCDTASAPAVAVNPSTDAQYVFWRGSDGDLHSANASSSGHWSSAVNMCDVYTVGCNMVNAPGAAAGDDGTQYVFWDATDGDLHSAHADPSGHWGSAVNMCDVYAVGCDTASTPGVAVNPSTDAQYVFWRDSDGDLHSANASSSGHWGSAVNMCDVYSVGCTMANTPGAAVTDDSTQYTFWDATDNDLHSANAAPSGHWGSAVNMCDVYAVGCDL